MELDRRIPFERFVSSEDPLSFEYIQQCTHSFRTDGGLLQDRLAVLENSFNRLQAMADAVSSQQVNSPALFVSLTALRRSIGMVRTFLLKNQPATAQTLLDQACDDLARIEAGVQQELLASRKLISSPFNTGFDQLPNYISFERWIQGATWSDNRLPSGSLSSLAAMARSGWVQHLNAVSDCEARVSLTIPRGAQTPASPDGSRCIQIQTWSPQGKDRPLEVTPVWIDTPQVPVQKSQVLRVDGYVRIQDPIQNSCDGFLIMDNIGGPELALRFQHTGTWQYFALERIVPNDMDFQLILAQTGLGTVELSNLQIRVCQPPGKSDK